MSSRRPTLNTNENITTVVRTLLGHQHKRQADLAAYLVFDSGTMSRAMNGARKWTPEDVENMADFFGKSVAIFFDDADELLRSRCILDPPVQLQFELADAA